MFLNDLHLFMEHCDSDYYADDATVHTHGNIQTEIEAKLQHDGNNKMEINYDKSTCIIVGTKHSSTKNIQPLNINVDGSKIRDVKETKSAFMNIFRFFFFNFFLNHL